MSFFWKPYVPVAERRAKAKSQMAKLAKKGTAIQPIELDGRKIAGSFWGKGWCDHLESFSDFANRLPRGRTYVRNGSVCHLDVQAGHIEAMVSGSELYKVTVKIKPLIAGTWDAIKDKCRGQIGSVLELLQGKLSNHVMAVVSDRTHGLFPQPGEIDLHCSCPDWATMCKHVAAVLYGVGSRLDHRPELLFLLRGVDAGELISAEVVLPTGATLPGEDALGEAGLADIFGIDIDESAAPPLTAKQPGIPSQKKAKGRPAKAKAPIAQPAVLKPAPLPAPVAKSAKAKKPAVPSMAAPAPQHKPMKAKKSASTSVAAAAPKHKPAKTKKSAAKTPAPAIFNPNAPTGEAVARLRVASSLSVAEFARALGVTPLSVQRWENTAGPLRIYQRPLQALATMQAQLDLRKK